MKNLLSNKTLQATYGGDVIGGSVVLGMLGAFLFKEVINGRPKGQADKVMVHPASPNHETLTFTGGKYHG